MTRWSRSRRSVPQVAPRLRASWRVTSGPDARAPDTPLKLQALGGVLLHRRESQRLPELLVANPREQLRRADVSDLCVLEVALEAERDLVGDRGGRERAAHEETGFARARGRR